MVQSPVVLWSIDGIARTMVTMVVMLLNCIVCIVVLMTYCYCVIDYLARPQMVVVLLWYCYLLHYIAHYLLY